MPRSLSDLRSIPYCSPNSHPDHPPRSPTLHYHFPKPQLTPKNSNMISLPSENPNRSLRHPITFQPLLFHFRPLALCSCFHVPISVSIIAPFQYFCSLILASTLPLYISTSIPLNSCDPLQHSLVQILNHLLSSTFKPPNL